jgi:hypothetical protein
MCLDGAPARAGAGTPSFGVAGRIAFDSAGNVPGRQAWFGRIRDGAVRLADGQ